MVSWYEADRMSHGYHGVNSDEVYPVADIRDHAYMSDRGCVMIIWAGSLPTARGLQYSGCHWKKVCVIIVGVVSRDLVSSSRIQV